MIDPETWTSPMQPEQLPGALFVILTALVAFATQAWLAILALALGCAFGWLTYSENSRINTAATFVALGLWVLGFVITFAGAI